MLTSKQRATLRGIACRMQTMLMVVTKASGERLIMTVSDPLGNRQLIKVHLVEEATESEVVQVIGSRFVLYKRNPKKPVIDLK